MLNSTEMGLDEAAAPPGHFGVGFDPLADKRAFPPLSKAELEEVGLFGTACFFEKDEPLSRLGDYPCHSYVILSGTVRVVDVSTGAREVALRYGEGYFTGDIDVLTRRPSVVAVEADTDVEAIRLTLCNLREMFTREPRLGEKFWRSFQRRRELLFGSNFRGLTIYGGRDDRATLDAVELLFRNSVPHQWVDTSIEANRLKLRALCPRCGDSPVVAQGSQVLFEAPSRRQLVDHLRLRPELPDAIYDLMIVGAGPAGLGAAVYAASGGLQTVVLDSLGPGGQAGSTSQIENYAGFPGGISGRDLSHLVYLQALKFGADFHVPTTVAGLDRRGDGVWHLGTGDGEHVLGRTIIVATGVSYGVLDIDGVDAFRGRGCSTVRPPSKPGRAGAGRRTSSGVAIPPGKPRCSCQRSPTRCHF
jgi:thioredoxin reductase (NADPH)